MSELNNDGMIAFLLVLGLFGAVFFIAAVAWILFGIREDLKNKNKNSGCGPNCTCGSNKQLLKG